MKKRKYDSLKSIYDRTEEIVPSSTIPKEDTSQPSGEEESLSTFVREGEHDCPTLSPPQVNEEGHVPSLHSGDAPSSSNSEESYSDIHAILSPNTEMEVVSSQAEIEKEVYQIAQKNGFELYEEGAHVLGQWVHGESSDPSTLSGILHDLREKGDQSEWFSNAIDAWSRQFMNPPTGRLRLSPLDP